MLDHGNNAGHIVINGGDDLFQGSFPLHGDVIIGYVVFYGVGLPLSDQLLQPDDTQERLPLIQHQQAVHAVVPHDLQGLDDGAPL